MSKNSEIIEDFKKSLSATIKSIGKKEDIEISGFLTSIISWGLRKTIIKNAFRMMKIMDNAPYDFILNATKNEISKVKFVHRTFNHIDFRYFLSSLSYPK